MQTQYQFDIQGIQLSPAIGLNYIRASRGNFFESGGNAALDVSDSHHDFLYMDLSARASKSTTVLNGMPLQATVGLGWRYEALGHSNEVIAGLSGAGDHGLRSYAAKFDRSRLLADVQLSAEIAQGIEAFFAYQGDVGTDYSNNRIKGGVSFQF